MTRAKPNIVTLTDAAAGRLKAILENAGAQGGGLRLGVKKGGCAGMEYSMDYAAEAAPGDEVIEDKGVRLFIEPAAVLYLLGTEMDYRTDRLSARFVFNNPNQISACGCGESVQLRPAGE